MSGLWYWNNLTLFVLIPTNIALSCSVTREAFFLENKPPISQICGVGGSWFTSKPKKTSNLCWQRLPRQPASQRWRTFINPRQNLILVEICKRGKEKKIDNLHVQHKIYLNQWHVHCVWLMPFVFIIANSNITNYHFRLSAVWLMFTIQPASNVNSWSNHRCIQIPSFQMNNAYFWRSSCSVSYQ